MDSDDATGKQRLAGSQRRRHHLSPVISRISRMMMRISVLHGKTHTLQQMFAMTGGKEGGFFVVVVFSLFGCADVHQNLQGFMQGLHPGWLMLLFELNHA